MRYFISLFLILNYFSNAQDNLVGTEWKIVNPFEQKNFIKNEGQFYFENSESKFSILFEAYSQGIHYSICDKGVVIWKYVNQKKEEIDLDEKDEFEPEQLDKIKLFDTILFLNANPNFEIILGEKTSNYYTYSFTDGRKDLKAEAFKTITFKNLYNQIDLLFEFPSDTNGIKYSFVLHPESKIEDIRLLFSKNSSLNKKQNGDLLVNGLTGTFTHHAPKTYIQDTKRLINSTYKILKNVLQFEINPPKEDEIVVIDPWVNSTSNLTGNNGAFDIDFDDKENVFVHGGSTQYTLNKYDKNGVLLWTNTPFNNEQYMYGDFAVDRITGNSYIIQGIYATTGVKVRKLDPNGSSIAFFSGNSKMGEMWRIVIDPCTRKGIIAGGGNGNSYSYQTALLDTTLANISPINYLNPSGQSWAGDIGYLAVDDYGFCYQLNVNSNNLIKLSLSNLNSVIYQVPAGYNFIEYSSNYFHDPEWYFGNGFNGISIINKTIYTTDGYDIKKWDSNNGTLIQSKSIASSPDGNKSNKYWSGIASNDCGDILVANNNKIELLDSGLNILNTFVMPNTVYDIMINNKTVYVSGQNFVKSFNINSLECPKVFINITQPDSCKGTGTATLTISGGISPYSVLWNSNPPQNTIAASGFLPGLAYSYTVEDNACPKNTNSDAIIINNPSQTNLFVTVDSVSCQKLNDGKISVSCRGGDLPYHYDWSNGQSGFNLNVLEDLNPGTYSLVVTDNKGCKNYLNIQLEYSKTFLFDAYNRVNVFTPNGDGNNDSFFPLVSPKNKLGSILSIIDEYNLTIYNRWGIKVFETTNPTECWDGQILNGDKSSEGNYFWVIKIRSNCINPKTEMIQGFVQLFR